MSQQEIGDTGLTRAQIAKKIEEAKEELHDALINGDYYEDYGAYVSIEIWKDGTIGVESHGPGVSVDPTAEYLIKVPTSEFESLLEEGFEMDFHEEEWKKEEEGKSVQQIVGEDAWNDALEEHVKNAIMVAEDSIDEELGFNIDGIIEWLETYVCDDCQEGRHRYSECGLEDSECMCRRCEELSFYGEGARNESA